MPSIGYGASNVFRAGSPSWPSGGAACAHDLTRCEPGAHVKGADRQADRVVEPLHRRRAHVSAVEQRTTLPFFRRAQAASTPRRVVHSGDGAMACGALVHAPRPDRAALSGVFEAMLRRRARQLWRPAAGGTRRASPSQHSRDGIVDQAGACIVARSTRGALRSAPGAFEGCMVGNAFGGPSKRYAQAIVGSVQPRR